MALTNAASIITTLKSKVGTAISGEEIDAGHIGPDTVKITNGQKKYRLRAINAQAADVDSNVHDRRILVTVDVFYGYNTAAAQTTLLHTTIPGDMEALVQLAALDHADYAFDPAGAPAVESLRQVGEVIAFTLTATLIYQYDAS